MFAAGDYASSPSGYVISALVVVLIMLLGYFGVRIFGRLDSHDNALIEIAKTTAVLVSDTSRTAQITATAVQDIDDLSTAVAVLQSWRNHHEAWAATEHERVMAYMLTGGSVVPRHQPAV